MTTTGVTYLLIFFLIVVGVYSIISSLSDLADRKAEEHSDVETKWFKWKGPVRLIFGLVCIILVIVVLKSDFDFTGDKAGKFEKQIESLTKENSFLKEKLNIKDSIPNYYYVSLENETGCSVLQGKVLFSNNYRTITVKGGTIFAEDKKSPLGNKFQAETGEKFYLFINNEFWGINVIESDIHSTRIVRLEVYKDQIKK